METEKIDRKHFLKSLALLGGGALVVPTILLQSCKAEPRVWSSLSQADISLLDALGETILPKMGDLPGAKDVGIGKYIVTMVQDCLAAEDQDVFLNGLTTIESLSFERSGDSFEKMDGGQRLALLSELQEEAIVFAEAHENSDPPQVHYFALLKDLVVSGYFSSELGMTQAREYLPIPQRFDGCIDYDEENDKPWAL